MSTGTPAAAPRFKVLVADKFAKEGLDWIKAQTDAELAYKPDLTEDQLAAIAGEHDAMIVRSGVTVTAKVLANPGRLKVVSRAGVGVDNIDLKAATAKGVLVMNAAEASTISTAEHAFTLLMALARNIGPAYKTMAEGGWDRNKFMGTQLHGKTLGVVGFGRIGQTVAHRALAFGMDVVAYDPVFNADTAMDGKVRMFKQFPEMLPHTDMLSFHVPLIDSTKGMLNDETFKKCRKGVLVVNAARGGVVDEDAILRAIEAGQCGGAALDVFVVEPPAKDSKLRNHPKILTTPHLGASTNEGQQAVSLASAESVMMYLRGQGIRGAVNAGGIRVDLDPEQQRYVDLASRMASLISPMISQGIAKITVRVLGKQLRPAAGTIERTVLVSLMQRHFSDSVNIINVAHVAQERGIECECHVVDADKSHTGDELIVTVEGPEIEGKREVRRIVGRVYADRKPRIVEINGYPMDMLPAGDMVLIQNEDRPGMIGMVGNEFGTSQVNIADMTISRRDTTALMVLRVDSDPPEALFNRLHARPGILKIAKVKLPE